ncbi:MAG: hypothetical protein HC814_00160 [Rhodobacteraceae bacterium]|nr:hypothetical protein [Paracoccaceae bacterium]
MVSGRTSNPEAAVAYLDFWSQNVQLNNWSGDPEFARIPSGKEAWTKPALAEKWPEWVSSYQAGRMFAGAEPMPRFIGVSAVESALGVALQSVVLGEKSVAEALAEANESAQAQIDILRG